MVVGLDGASYNIIDPLIQKGKLSNIAKLLQIGTSYHLLSTIPSNTPVAWTSMTTGMNPGKHGIFGFFRYDKDLEAVSSLDNKSLYVWDLLGIHGKSSLIINVPFTWPPQKIKGAIASFDFAPINKKKQIAEPLFIDQYIKEYGYNKITVFHPERESIPSLSRFQEIVKMETEFAFTASNIVNWDLLFIVFMVSDAVIHIHPTNTDLISRVYEIIDQAIGQLIKIINLDNDQILITSDHGTRIFTQGYPILPLLRKQRFIQLKSAFTRRVVFTYLVKEFLRDVLFNYLKFNPILLFDEIQKISIKKLERVRKSDSKLHLGNLFNKEESPLIILNEKSGIDLLLKINEKIFPRKYKRQLSQLFLKNLNTEERKIIKRVWVSDDLYSGPYIDNAPDLIIELKKNLYTILSPLSYYRRAKIVPCLRGGHTRRGVLICAGKDISQEHTRGVASILSITPTILHAFHLPIPQNMDGTVILDMFKKGSSLSILPKYVNINTKKRTDHRINKNSYTSEEDVVFRLRKLGYL